MLSLYIERRVQFPIKIQIISNILLCSKYGTLGIVHYQNQDDLSFHLHRNHHVCKRMFNDCHTIDGSHGLPILLSITNTKRLDPKIEDACSEYAVSPHTQLTRTVN